MRREVEAARLFGDNPHVLPVLDWSPSHDWFVMPLADDTARGLATGLTEAAGLRALVTAICEALREPHRQGWVHRDLKPDNVLWLGEEWVVADWGLGGRPRGETTHPRRTQIGVRFGTEGFAAPELAVDAHEAGPSADVYSIGQIIGWALTGAWPQPNIPLLPPSGSWRTIIRAATLHDPARRVGTVDELLSLIAAEFDTPTDLTTRGRRLLASDGARDESTLTALFRMAAQSDLDHSFFQSLLLTLNEDQIHTAVSADALAVGEVVRAIRPLFANGSPGRLSDDDRSRTLTWLLTVAEHAEALVQWDLFDEATDVILYLMAAGPASPDVDSQIGAWITSRSATAASIVAAVLRRTTRQPRLIDWADGRAMDQRIRLALLPRQPTGGVLPASGADIATGGRTAPSRTRGQGGAERYSCRRRSLLPSPPYWSWSTHSRTIRMAHHGAPSRVPTRTVSRGSQASPANWPTKRACNISSKRGTAIRAGVNAGRPLRKVRASPAASRLINPKPACPPTASPAPMTAISR